MRLPIDGLTGAAYRVPTEQPEADGTLSWSATVIVVVRARAGGREGLGWTYAGRAAKDVVDERLADVITGIDLMDVERANQEMTRGVRNLGHPGLAACAISATDIALWDLKARVLGVPLASLLGRARDDVPIYGSGGFTTYSDDETQSQLQEWTAKWEIPRVKIKIGESWGTDERRDLHRVDLARRCVGDEIELYVDANGGYTRKQAVRVGQTMHHGWKVTWFEEPVSSDDLTGLREVRDQCPADIAAGEYGYSPWYFVPMVNSGAVDCIQADVTRCGGITGWRTVAQLALANNLQLSGHCAPNAHAHVAVSVPNLRHLEYFHDHVRIESMLFDGTLVPSGGALLPDGDAPGHGLTFKDVDAELYRVA